MTEQLIYKIYKISNTIDDKIYIGSTRQKKLRQRMDGHKCDVRNGNQKKLSCHMRGLGVENFNIELIKEIMVPDRKIARIQEQIEIFKYPQEQLLNTLRAFTHNADKTRNNEKKKKNRRDYYHRKKQNPEWMEKERERSRIKMRKKRQLARSRATD